jgi:predicted thioesterase
VNNVFTVPAVQSTWKTITTPYLPSVGRPNVAGTVETRATASPGSLTIASRVTSAARRIVRFTGRVTQGGAAVAGAQVSVLINGRARFRARTNAGGNYSVVLKKTGKKTTARFQARVTVAERDITTTGCSSPTLPGVACVSATASGFTAVSRVIRIRL